MSIVSAVGLAVAAAGAGFLFGRHWPCSFAPCRRRRMREDLAASQPDARG